uniref:Uncharacterized protein n=1 Tax=Oryza barthii TaxID=65489 RepID=A0A0D3H9K1_9ORYZ
MEVKVLSSKLVKPAYNGGVAAAPDVEYIPLSIFDKVTYKMQMAIIYAFPPPAPSTAAIEKGLAAVLAQYRAFAGQLGESPDGEAAVVLNDRGARLVEAAVDADLVDMAPAKPTPELLRLHPDLEGELQEVVLLQLTRFRCGSLAVGFTSNHVVADGHATSNFLVAWGRATRGLPMGAPPVHHHAALFKPRPSPRHAAQVIHDEVARVDGAYFRSFLDFALSGAGGDKEGLAPSAVLKDVLCPNAEVDSWLTFPFYELDFGTGSPTYFMPSYFPTEGMLFLVPSYLGDGSVDAFVPVFNHNLEAFKECCYSME